MFPFNVSRILIIWESAISNQIFKLIKKNLEYFLFLHKSISEFNPLTNYLGSGHKCLSKRSTIPSKLSDSEALENDRSNDKSKSFKLIYEIIAETFFFLYAT